LHNTKALRRNAGRFFSINISINAESGIQEMKMDKTHSKGKIVRGTRGIGAVTPLTIEERAREIACSDGRAKPNDLDRTNAREELTGATSGSEKLPMREEPGRDWEMPLVSTGEKAPTVRPEDAENVNRVSRVMCAEIA